MQDDFSSPCGWAKKAEPKIASCEAIAKVLYLDDDTIRYWYKLYGEKGLNWLADFGYKGRACELTVAQQDALKNWVSQTLPLTLATLGLVFVRTGFVGAPIAAWLNSIFRGSNDFNDLCVSHMGFKKGNTLARDSKPLRRDMTLALISKLNEPSAPASSATGEFV